MTQVTLQYNSTSQSGPAPACAPGQVPGRPTAASWSLDSYAYDPAGLLATTTDAMGRITNYLYNGDEELVATADA